MSWLAYLLCVGSGCFALSVMLDALHGYRLNPVSPWLTLVLAILLGLVCVARGESGPHSEGVLMDAPLLLKNTGTSLILCDANGKPLLASFP